VKRTRSPFKKALLALALGCGIAVSSSVPAQAVSSLAIVYVGSQTQAVGYTVWTNTGGLSQTLYTRAYWTNHTATTAKLTYLYVCLGSGIPMVVNTDIAISGTVVVDYPYQVIQPNKCAVYNVQKTFTKRSSGELMRVWAWLTDTIDFSQYIQTVAYYR
jgi:hypothetical protein